MTIPDFRRQTTLVQRMRELLSDPVMQHALEAMKDSNPPVEADPRDDAIVSVRILSGVVGYNFYHRTLLSLADPLPEPVELVANYQPET